jgi:hypothetical protein
MYDFGRRAGTKETTRKSKTCVDDNKMYLGEIRCCGMGWIDVAQDRDKLTALVSTVMNPRLP